MALTRSTVMKLYAAAIIIAGSVVVAFSVVQLPIDEVGLAFVLLGMFTAVIVDYFDAQFPQLTRYISLPSVFICLAILLFDTNAAVLVAAVAGVCSSLRAVGQPLRAAFAGLAMAISAFLTVTILKFEAGTIATLSGNELSAAFAGATLLMAFAQYVTQSKLLVIGRVFGSARKQSPLQRVSPAPYFSAAVLAAVAARYIGVEGFYVILAVGPITAIVAFVFFGHLIVHNQFVAKEAEAEKAKQSLAEAQESEELFRSAFDQAPIGMGLVSPDGRWLQVNQSLCDIVGYSEEELLRMDFQSITHSEDLYNFLCHFSHVAKGGGSSDQVEKRYAHKQGHDVWVTVNISLVRDSQTGSLHIIFQIQDITDRKQAEQRLLHDAFHDPLTGLPNRAWLMDQLNNALVQAKRYRNQFFAVLFLDLDRFKVINDSIGHMVGDQLLVGIAERLRGCLRPGDVVARLGGDEFTVLLRRTKDAREATEIAERIQEEVAAPFVLEGYETSTTASIGIALYDPAYERPEELLRDADTAMYHAKSQGKARHVLFHKGMHAHAMNLLQLEIDMRLAIDRKEFFIEYQPIVSLESGTLNGFEALVRWQHPERGLISPDHFITMAEEAGYIVPIGQWVLQEACAQMQSWQSRLSPNLPLCMSVNLSSQQFRHASLLDQIVQTLDQTGMDPRALKLEITESVVMENFDSVIVMLNRLREQGVELSIDDFGTGYSSLSYLHRLPINTLKIDRSFVSRLGENNENKEIVRTIILLARNLGMGVIAEGVETTEQLGRLREMKCEDGQGFLFSRPLSADCAEKFIVTMSKRNSGPLLLEAIHDKALQEELARDFAASLPLATASVC